MRRMVIKGSEWHRGGSANNMDSRPRLLTPKGKRCCVGIHARLCGIPDDHIRDVSWPTGMDPKHITRCYVPWLGEQKQWYDLLNAPSINDRPGLTDEERIAKLRPIFAKIGVTIVWRPDL